MTNKETKRKNLVNNLKLDQLRQIVDMVKDEIEANEVEHYSLVTDGTEDIWRGRLEFAMLLDQIIHPDNWNN